MTRGAFSALVACLALLCSGAAAAAGPPRLLEGFRRADAMIETPRACHLLDVYLAETPEQRGQGLMFVRELGEFEGMLFPSPEPAAVQMWMKNTYLPLDMLFIGADGRITGIARSTTPLSEKIIASPGPVSAVLELNGGFAARHAVAVGDRFAVLP